MSSGREIHLLDGVSKIAIGKQKLDAEALELEEEDQPLDSDPTKSQCRQGGRWGVGHKQVE